MAQSEVSFVGDIPGAMRRASRPIANDFAETGLVILQRNCPVDTGELRDSCFTQVVESPGSDLKVRMGATAKHAAPVEFGHLTRGGTFVPPNPFIRRSMAALTRGRR